MKALIIEDQPYIRKGLTNLLKEIDADIQVVGECESVREAIVVAQACNPELVFLDINLSDGSGFDFIDQTSDLDFKIIFITAYEEHALRALKIGAVDYLLKPLDVNALSIAINKIYQLPAVEQRANVGVVKEEWNKTKSTMILSLQDSFQVVDLKELLFCESNKGYTTFYLNSGKKHITSKPLKEYEQQLSKANFTRPHQSFMVNLKFIDKYDKSGIIHLVNSRKIPVSSRKKDAFVSAFLEYNGQWKA